MILLFLHGLPATGKYTVGRELAALTGFELYHNHLVVDDILHRHAFGSPGFVQERDVAWRTHFTRAAAANDRNIIFTFNPENSVPQVFIDWLFDGLGPGVVVHSVELRASEPVIESRLASTQRQGFRKLTDLELYRQLRTTGVFAAPIIPRTELVIDTVPQEPPETARLIVEYFKLVGR